SLPDPPRTKQVVYRAHMKSGQIAGLFSDCLSQRVKPADEGTAEITVLAVRPDRPAMLTEPQNQPSAADLEPNNFIQRDDSLTVKMASAVAPQEADSWKLGCALEKFVKGAVVDKTFSQAFATAAEVARTREGDCTEHAVLMAALCRARMIPARC